MGHRRADCTNADVAVQELVFPTRDVEKKRKVSGQEVRDGRFDEVRPSGLRMRRSERRSVGQVLQRILQGAGRQDRAALRVPAPGLPLTRSPRGGRGRLPYRAVAIALALSAGGCSSPAVDKAAGDGAGAGIAVTTAADG